MDELPPLTPRMRRSLARALAIATENDQHVVGTEHVLLAFLDDRDGIAGMVLEVVGAADRVRAEVIRIITSTGCKDPTQPGPPPFRAT
jgi:ATP-dependent Clp protease ATP-binding subunit ClpA